MARIGARGRAGAAGSRGVTRRGRSRCRRRPRCPRRRRGPRTRGQRNRRPAGRPRRGRRAPGRSASSSATVMSKCTRLRCGRGASICWNQMAGPCPAGSTMASVGTAARPARRRRPITALQNGRMAGMSSASMAISSICTGRGDCADVAPAGASPSLPTAPEMRRASCVSRAGHLAQRPGLQRQLDPVGAQVHAQVTVGVRPARREPRRRTPRPACASDRTGTDRASVPSRYRQPRSRTASEAAVLDSGVSGPGSVMRSQHASRWPGRPRPARRRPPARPARPGRLIPGGRGSLIPGGRRRDGLLVSGQGAVAAEPEMIAPIRPVMSGSCPAQP